eukprot:1152506-Pyramimonas_sp.AAC.1
MAPLPKVPRSSGGGGFRSADDAGLQILGAAAHPETLCAGAGRPGVASGQLPDGRVPSNAP